MLLESMACGTPVVATAVNGAPEVVRTRAAGLLVHERTPAALLEAVRDLRADLPARHETRRYAEGFGWAEIASANRALLTAVARAGRQGGAAQGGLICWAEDVERAPEQA